MRIIIVFISGLLWFSSCSSENAEKKSNSDVKQKVVLDAEKPEPSQEELSKNTTTLIAKIIDASSLQLQMNGDQKWELNSESYLPLMKIKQQIYIISGNMENYEVSSYNEMGAEFLDFLKSIPVVEEQTANAEFQKVLSATKEQCVFMLGSDLQQAQISVINLSVIYDEVPNYFVSK
jgi:hypothetical protein